MSVKQLITIEDLWEMPEKPGVRFELVDGELVEVPGAGAVHTMIMVTLFKLLSECSQRHQYGIVFPDGLGYILSPHPGRLRIPDVSFVSRDRIPSTGIPEGFWPGAPDLAVEIVSPNDRAEDVHAKVGEYLEAGARAVWVLWPRERSVTVYGAAGSVNELGPDDELDGGDVLPGFSVRVDKLFDVQLPA